MKIVNSFYPLTTLAKISIFDVWLGSKCTSALKHLQKCHDSFWKTLWTRQSHSDISFRSRHQKKETLAQVFSCKFCEIFKNMFFKEHLWTTDSFSLNYIFLETSKKSLSKWRRWTLQKLKLSIYERMHYETSSHFLLSIHIGLVELKD